MLLRHLMGVGRRCRSEFPGHAGVEWHAVQAAIAVQVRIEPVVAVDDSGVKVMLSGISVTYMWGSLQWPNWGGPRPTFTGSGGCFCRSLA